VDLIKNIQQRCMFVKEERRPICTLVKIKGIPSFTVSSGVRGWRHASQNLKAVVLPSGRAGPKVSASLCGNAIGFAEVN